MKIKHLKIAEIWRYIDDECIGLYAAQGAFFTILSAVPFVMLIAVAVKRFVNIDIEEFILPMLDIFPKNLAEYIAEITAEAVGRSESVAMVSAAVVSMLWSSSRGTLAIYSGLNNIFGTIYPYRGIKARIVSFCYNIIVVFAIIASVVVLMTVNKFFGFVFRLKFLWLFLVLVIVFSAIYAFFPQRKSRYIYQLPGAAASAAGWIIFSYLFSLYIKYFSKFPLLYGSLTAVALLMLWVYFAQYMFLLGAKMNKLLCSYFGNVKNI